MKCRYSRGQRGAAQATNGLRDARARGEGRLHVQSNHLWDRSQTIRRASASIVVVQSNHLWDRLFSRIIFIRRASASSIVFYSIIVQSNHPWDR
eukprot:scaffold16158_cov135-Isochrysis_galbana.AAC.2